MLSSELKNVFRNYFENLIHQKDLSVCDRVLSSNYVDHDAPGNTPSGPKATKDYVANMQETFPDMRIPIEDLIAESNQVAGRMIWKGTHGDTGEVFHRMGIVMVRLNERGQFVERWSMYADM
jgi:predicted ester cyclase